MYVDWRLKMRLRNIENMRELKMWELNLDEELDDAERKLLTGGKWMKRTIGTKDELELYCKNRELFLLFSLRDANWCQNN